MSLSSGVSHRSVGLLHVGTDIYILSRWRRRGNKRSSCHKVRSTRFGGVFVTQIEINRRIGVDWLRGVQYITYAHRMTNSYCGLLFLVELFMATAPWPEHWCHRCCRGLRQQRSLWDSFLHSCPARQGNAFIFKWPSCLISLLPPGVLI